MIFLNNRFRIFMLRNYLKNNSRNPLYHFLLVYLKEMIDTDKRHMYKINKFELIQNIAKNKRNERIYK